MRDQRAELRDQAAACLQGFDAKPEKYFEADASSIAWDATGRQLLAGGLTEEMSGVPREEARLWDS